MRVSAPGWPVGDAGSVPAQPVFYTSPFLPPCSPVWLFSRWLELSRGGDDVRAPGRGRDAEG